MLRKWKLKGKSPKARSVKLQVFATFRLQRYNFFTRYANFRNRKLQKILIFMLKLLRNSKKCSNFAADFSRLLDYKWEDIWIAYSATQAYSWLTKVCKLKRNKKTYVLLLVFWHGLAGVLFQSLQTFMLIAPAPVLFMSSKILKTFHEKIYHQ